MYSASLRQGEMTTYRRDMDRGLLSSLLPEDRTQRWSFRSSRGGHAGRASLTGRSRLPRPGQPSQDPRYFPPEEPWDEHSSLAIDHGLGRAVADNRRERVEPRRVPAPRVRTYRADDGLRELRR